MGKVMRVAVYRRLLLAYGLNELAWAFGALALALLVYRHTHSSLATAAFYLSAQIAPALIAPLAIARIDRLPTGRVLPLLYGTEAIAFAALAWLTGRFTLPGILALALLDGSAAITARALARASTVAVLTRADLLREGNTLTNVAFSLAYMTGPALAGLLVATGGTRAALALNTVLFGAVALNLATTRGLPEATPESQSGAVERVRAGLSYARGEAAVRGPLTVQLLIFTFVTISTPVEVVFAEHSLHAGSTGYGLLLTAWGGGTLVGSALFARYRRRPNRTLVSTGALLLAAGLLAMAASPGIAGAIVAAAVCGTGNGIELVAARTALQEAAEAGWMAVVMGLYESIAAAAPGIGILAGGAIAALSSPRVALALAGLGGAVAAAAARRLIAPQPAQAPVPPAARRSDVTEVLEEVGDP